MGGQQNKNERPVVDGRPLAHCNTLFKYLIFLHDFFGSKREKKTTTTATAKCQ